MIVRILRFLAPVALTALGSCASIFGKSSYSVSIQSAPSEAQFVVKDEAGQNVHQGTTPAMVTLKSGEAYFDGRDYTVVFSKPGYADQTLPLMSQLEPWYFGNILIGGLIGMLIVDPLTGAMWKLPTKITATLPATPVAAAP
jgi:hypothetical protein